MGVAAYLRCFCKFTALFVFAFSELTGCPTSPLPLSYDSAEGHHEVVFSLYFSSSCYLPRRNGK